MHYGSYSRIVHSLQADTVDQVGEQSCVGDDRLTEALPSSTRDSHDSESQISFILTELTGSMGEHIWEVFSESGLRNTHHCTHILLANLR